MPRAQASSSVHGQTEERRVDLALKMNSSFSKVQTANRTFLQAAIEGNINALTGANRVPLGPNVTRPANPVRFTGPCSRCLSHKHNRPTCSDPIRCTECFRLGHVTSTCRFLPRFLGLSKILPSPIKSILIVGTSR